ncbi:hypothetical protein SAMN00790413_04217 [Deinococcus hopiensis KR-140]|uniref:Uncharacterized protein n=1 Tax=Deinococcus hopiensis KR-140 TaxID=695939 RepID=A0A1W1UPG0_9DEIO|nr:hypothetical protein SAMN00790413_04217 [Deinococcus hopiensis KR-140]
MQGTFRQGRRWLETMRVTRVVPRSRRSHVRPQLRREPAHAGSGNRARRWVRAVRHGLPEHEGPEAWPEFSDAASLSCARAFPWICRQPVDAEYWYTVEMQPVMLGLLLLAGETFIVVAARLVRR